MVGTSNSAQGDARGMAEEDTHTAMDMREGDNGEAMAGIMDSTMDSTAQKGSTFILSRNPIHSKCREERGHINITRFRLRNNGRERDRGRKGKNKRDGKDGILERGAYEVSQASIITAPTNLAHRRAHLFSR